MNAGPLVTAPNSGIPAALSTRRADDMEQREWDALEQGLAKFFAEEREEDEHAADAEPTLTKEEAGYVFPAPGPKLCENCSMFQPAGLTWAGGGTCTLVIGPIEPRAVCQKHEWAAGAAHDAIATDEQLREYRRQAFADLAVDFAEDAPVGGREEDQDGRLRVARVHISKANVCPYKGKEIPGWDDEAQVHALGLDPDKIYWLYRDPEELEKGARSSNGVQLLKKHTPVSADDAKQYDVVGSVGTEAHFAHPFLDNSITLWTKPDIEGVKSGEKQQLSMGYHYRPDMTPGLTADGEKFDGVMRDIKVNHVALVEQGRAGPDVVVADSLDALAWAVIEEALCVDG